MPLPVDLQDVVQEMQAVSDHLTAYINRRTGELVTITDEDIELVEASEPSDNLPDWQAEALPKVREVLESKDFIPLPDRFDLDEWSIMKRFAASQSNPDHCRDLLDAIHGSGAFRMFRSLVDRLTLRDDWFRFRDEAFEDIATDFLKANKIPFTRRTRLP